MPLSKTKQTEVCWEKNVWGIVSILVAVRINGKKKNFNFVILQILTLILWSCYKSSLCWTVFLHIVKQWMRENKNVALCGGNSLHPQTSLFSADGQAVKAPQTFRCYLRMKEDRVINTQMKTVSPPERPRTKCCVKKRKQAAFHFSVCVWLFILYTHNTNIHTFFHPKHTSPIRFSINLFLYSP